MPLQNYTQNIDTLETLVGIKRVLQCHGSFATATCQNPDCGRKETVAGSYIEQAILHKTVPLCPICQAKEEAKTPKKAAKKAKAKRSWDGDDSESDDSITRSTPAAVMKVGKPSVNHHV